MYVLLVLVNFVKDFFHGTSTAPTHTDGYYRYWYRVIIIDTVYRKMTIF